MFYSFISTFNRHIQVFKIYAMEFECENNTNNFSWNLHGLEKIRVRSHWEISNAKAELFFYTCRQCFNDIKKRHTTRLKMENFQFITSLLHTQSRLKTFSQRHHFRICNRLMWTDPEAYSHWSTVNAKKTQKNVTIRWILKQWKCVCLI